MFELFDLPLELQEEIFRKCEKKDIRKLACCSSTCNEAVKPTLWSSLTVPFYSLMLMDCRRPVDMKKLSNLKHVRDIHFSVRHRSLIERKSQPVPYNPKKLLHNFSKFVSYCDPDTVSSLRIRRHLDLALHACRVFRNLKELDVSFIDELTGEIFAAIAGLPLVKLNLRESCVAGAQLRMVSCKSLSQLDITDCSDISAETLEYIISTFPNLQELAMNNTIGNDSIFEGVADKLSSLRRLEISAAGITGAGLQSISKMRHLQHLDISSCVSLKSGDMVHISGMNNLRTLILENSNIVDHDVWHLAQLTSLRELQMAWCVNITDSAMVHIETMKSLHSLDITYIKGITDSGLRHLKRMRSLKVLKCSHTGITDRALRPLDRRMEIEHIVSPHERRAQLMNKSSDSFS